MSYSLQTTGENKDLNVSYIFVPPDLIMVHTEDVTERKHAEDESRELANAVEQTADSVVITSKDGIIKYVNPAFEDTTGYTREEVLGKKPSVLKSGKHDSAFYQKMWCTVMKGNPFRGTIINKKKNGELFWCQQTITPMKDRGGNITNLVSVAKDITELKKKQEQEFQFRIARELQQRLYKADVSVPGFDIAGATYSALETNGDYFDFIRMPDGYIGLVIGDVCGHGLGSALIMAETRAYLHAFAKTESDPGIILTRLNQELSADLDEFHYVTLIFARLDPQRNLMDYASAGHVPAYLLDGSGEIVNKLESTGIPLGFVADYKFNTSDSIKLPLESTVVLLTDGISEAQTPDEIEFGDKRALNIINEHKQSSAKQILVHLYQAVCSFSKNQPQADDITSLICKVLRTS